MVRFSETTQITPVLSSGAAISSETGSTAPKGSFGDEVPRPATQDQWERGELNYTGDCRFKIVLTFTALRSILFAPSQLR